MILHPEELDRSSFRKLGDFEDLLTTSDTFSGKKTEEGFFPDVLRLSSNGKDTSVSVTKVCGGSGGGKPDSAMGGGKDPLMVDNALAMVDNVVSMKLGV